MIKAIVIVVVLIVSYLLTVGVTWVTRLAVNKAFDLELINSVWWLGLIFWIVLLLFKGSNK